MTAIEVGVAGVALAVLTWCIGLGMGARAERNAWTMRALPNGSGTAHHCDGQFYYILTEKHFVEDFIRRSSVPHLTQESES